MIDEVGKVKDAVFYNKLDSECGSVTHSGDNLTGKDDASKDFDEIITIDMQKMDLAINYLAIVINNFKESGFKGVSNASATILGEDN